MRLRRRLVALLLIVVIGPVAGGIVAARALAVRQAIAVADARLEGAAPFARAALDALSAEARRRLTSSLALRAAAASSTKALESLRRQAGLDYLVVASGRSARGAVRAASFIGVHVTAALLAGSPARTGLVSEARVKVVGGPGSTVWGGMLRDRTFLTSAVRAPAVTVASGRVVASTVPGLGNARVDAPGTVGLAGGRHGLCVCAGTAPSGVMLVGRPAPVGAIPPLRPVSVAVAIAALFVGLLLAFVLAKVVSNPIQRLAEDTSSTLREEIDLLRREVGAWDEHDLAGPEGPGEDEVTRLREAFWTLRGGLRRAAGELGGSREELRRTRARLSDQERISLSDSLTGAWNRRYLDIALSDAMQRGRRLGHPFSVLMVDIDHFKRINDRFGHGRGDEVLVELCRRISSGLRAHIDVLARYGGEEFVLLLPETGPDGAAVVAMKVCEQMRSRPFSTPANPISVTVSIGVASYPQDGSDATAVVAAADANMYQAKRSGRDRVVTSGPLSARRP